MREAKDELQAGDVVVGYVRVSTDGQTDKFGIDAQKKEIVRYCNEHQLNLINIYVDSISGVKEERPEFDKIIFGALQNPPVQALIVAKSDRVARDINIYFYYKHELMTKGIKLISVNDDFSAFGSFAPILESFIVVMAQMERENITKRTSGGRLVKAMRGGYAGGRTPIGYYASGGKLHIDTREAQIVKIVYNMYHKQKMSMYQIVKELEHYDEAVNRKGEKLTFSSIQNILKRNEYIYRGLYRYGKVGNWVMGNHEPLLDPETDPPEVRAIKEQYEKAGLI